MALLSGLNSNGERVIIHSSVFDDGRKYTRVVNKVEWIKVWDKFDMDRMEEKAKELLTQHYKIVELTKELKQLGASITITKDDDKTYHDIFDLENTRINITYSHTFESPK